MSNVFNRAKKFLVDQVNVTTANQWYASLWTSFGSFPLAGTDLDDLTVADVETTYNEVTTGAVASYARQVLTGGATTQNDTNDRAEIAFTKADFGALESGATIVAVALVRRNTAGMDADASDVPWGGYEVNPSVPTNGGNVEVRWSGVDGVGDAIHIL